MNPVRVPVPLLLLVRRTMILAGIDEAGYGPTLGPLVVSIAVFRVEREPDDLWNALSPAVCRKPDGHRVPVDDSKKLYQRRKGLRDLEEGVLPFLRWRHRSIPRTLRGLLDQVSGKKIIETLDRYPWYAGRDTELPVDTFRGVIRARSDTLASAGERAGIRLVGIASEPLHVAEFNRSLASGKNKATVSFAVIAGFLRRLWKQFPNDEVDVVIDRQGGRMRYGPSLYEGLHPRSIRIESQDADCSVYRLSRREDPAGNAPFRVRFAKESDATSLAVSLASMSSKYVRELHMRLFNEFWSEKLRDVKPTAGYALDARRFLREIRDTRARLGIRDDVLIRRK